MTSTRSSAEQSPAERRAVDVLEKRIRASRRALLVERVWPCVWPPVAVALLFVLASLLGLWTVVSGLTKNVALSVFAVAALVALVPLARIPWPTREEAIRRLEQKSGIAHRPASAYEDTLTQTGVGATDQRHRTIWQAHRDRLAAKFGALRPGRPEPRVDRRDPFALRAALLLGTIVAGLMVWPVAGERLLSVFTGATTSSLLEARLDAWVTPPHYTGKAPVMLADGSVPQRTDTDEARMFEVPAGSKLIIRASGIDSESMSVTFRKEGAQVGVAIAEKQNESKSTDRAAASEKSTISEFALKLADSGIVSLNVNESRLKGWQFNVTPDAPPVIKLAKPAGRSARGALALNYEITDDYGVLGAEATFALSPKSRKDAGVTADSANSLWPAPKIPLRLPRRNSKKVAARTYKDLTAHPWAGLEVEMTLTARDQAPQVGRSEPYVYKLPARDFRKPLAKAIVEQRRKLAINPSARAQVAVALNALTIAPELFTPDRVVYLGLRSAYWRITHHDWYDAKKGVAEDEKSKAARKRSNGILKGLVDQLWDIALRVEDGDLSQAERDLRDAQDRLSEALKNGATDDEISKLTKELREAMNRFMRSMQQQARQQGQQQQAQGPNPNSRQLSQRDLDKMLKDIEKLAKSGSRDAAQQMLEQLRNMMEQLQTAQGQQQQQSGRMQQQMREFGDLIRDQQRLLDDTFNARQGKGRDGKQGKRKGQQGKQGEGQKGRDGSGRSQGLSQRQGSLKNNLGRLLDSLQGFGGQTPKQLDQAQRAMRGAQKSLEKGDLDRATRQQGEALDQLRQGARQMAQEMLKGMAGQQAGRRPRDPLGRGRDEQNNGQQSGDGPQIPGEIDVQKARRILEELRRRASDPNRPSLELDYIERLLERF